MIDQVKECREDCGSCGAAACCTLEWELPDTNSTEFAAQMVSLLRRGGPDNLFRLEGHLVNYKEWATDLYDDSPRNIQAVHAPKEFAANNQAISEDRVDEIAFSVYDVSASSARVVAFSVTKRHSVLYQCDGGSNYKGLRMLISASGVPLYRERRLFGCYEQEFGTFPASISTGQVL